ncbi:MAG TPA: cyclodeaminase/cyclohydrolase family protein [Thermotogota bacterium]|nr:cyclodeaminase/cyclohydrolase family protein [Thermotogota bacterium]
MDFRKMSIDEFLDTLGSSSPTPGGGTVAALSGALAAGLTKMVASLTQGKKGYEDRYSLMQETALLETQEIEWFKTMMDEDSKAFNQVTTAMKLPKETPVQKEVRTSAIQEAFKTATKTPYEIAQHIVRLVPRAALMAHYGNKNAKSDALCALELCKAGFHMALENISINLEMIKDVAFVQHTRNAVSELKTQFEGGLKQAIDQ